ncbi:MAG: DNA-binding protein WhiA [Oscillospiraceae bacterium]|nr:DNA-binding protein WhiA [Oscillospiraceae bacterium]
MESFSAKVKQELCRLPTGRQCCAVAESYGALLLGNTFSRRELRIVTTHDCFVRRLRFLLQTIFGVMLDLPPPTLNGAKQIISARQENEIQAIRGVFGYGKTDEVALHLNNAILENECCPGSFWRGAFLSGGTVQDPEKAYHLELATPHRFLARELAALLREGGFEPGHTERGGVQILYSKSSENIEDFLTLTGAFQSAVFVMNTKIEKDLRNLANRRVNCDNANLNKVVISSFHQRENIIKLQNSKKWDTLSHALRQAAELRLEYPEDSLSELAKRLSVSKSCLNHRLRKLETIANSIRG